ncbi:uncharacterized protein [Palaemon carinicauda]|uniref:uncharacterized protein n=1 Tax=Palaemon carinicauda TaxID=392227 RepID=UPI0035B5E0B2
MQQNGKQLGIFLFYFCIVLQVVNAFDELGSSSHFLNLTKRDVVPPTRYFVNCGSITVLDETEIAMIYSDTERTSLKCKRTFQGPDGRALGLTCQNFNLNPRGCKREKMIVKEPGFGKSKFCRSASNIDYISADNNLIINHVRKSLSNKECSGGYFCEVTVL